MNAPLHSFNQFLDPFAHAPGRASAVLGAPSLNLILDQARIKTLFARKCSIDREK
jgi:hypothetical protein